MARHPAPPFYRTSRPGKMTGRHRVTLAAPAVGRTPPNACVPPLVYTNGIGERTLYHERSVKLSAPAVDLD